MAYPVLTDLFRAQVVFQGSTGLAEDVFVNNFYFRNDTMGDFAPGGPYQVMQDVVSDALDEFYTAPAANTDTVATFLHGSITSVTYKVYDLGYATPRYPIVEDGPRPWAPDDTSPALPGEVALCLSFKGGPLARERGRVYIGPLNEKALGTQTGPVRPAVTFQECLGEAATRLIAGTGFGGITWVAVSPKFSSSVEVTEAWCDNAFDTQRSRGVSPTGRLRFDETGVIT